MSLSTKAYTRLDEAIAEKYDMVSCLRTVKPPAGSLNFKSATAHANVETEKALVTEGRSAPLPGSDADERAATGFVTSLYGRVYPTALDIRR